MVTQSGVINEKPLPDVKMVFFKQKNKKTINETQIHFTNTTFLQL